MKRFLFLNSLLFIFFSLSLSPSVQAQQAVFPARVLKVIDGNTLEISYQGKREDARLIGIDSKNERGALRYLESHVKQGDTVWIEFDIQLTDTQGRLLNYIYLKNGKMLNEEILKKGYARLKTIPPNIKYENRFLSAYRTAREYEVGLWRKDKGIGEKMTKTEGTKKLFKDLVTGTVDTVTDLSVMIVADAGIASIKGQIAQVKQSKTELLKKFDEIERSVNQTAKSLDSCPTAPPQSHPSQPLPAFTPVFSSARIETIFKNCADYVNTAKKVKDDSLELLDDLEYLLLHAHSWKDFIRNECSEKGLSEAYKTTISQHLSFLMETAQDIANRYDTSINDMEKLLVNYKECAGD